MILTSSLLSFLKLVLQLKRPLPLTDSVDADYKRAGQSQT